jgi:ABC-type nitrate/sulfonate/bicarbonate transport system ATPase subunit
MFNSGNNRKKPVTDHFLSVQGLCKSYNTSGTRIDILKQATLDLNAGETLAIVGASGIGKSTLLHLLGALTGPIAGRIFSRVRISFFLIIPGWHNSGMNL